MDQVSAKKIIEFVTVIGDEKRIIAGLHGKRSSNRFKQRLIR